MTLQYTTASNVLPENKMRLYPTKVINIIGGPGCDKSLFSSAIILRLNLRNKSVESIPDYAKSLVWHIPIVDPTTTMYVGSPPLSPFEGGRWRSRRRPRRSQRGE